MKKPAKRLQLKRETVRELDQAKLGQAQGGIITTPITIPTTQTGTDTDVPPESAAFEMGGQAS